MTANHIHYTQYAWVVTLNLSKSKATFSSWRTFFSATRLTESTLSRSQRTRGGKALSAKCVYDAAVARHFCWWLCRPMREPRTNPQSSQVQFGFSVGGGVFLWAQRGFCFHSFTFCTLVASMVSTLLFECSSAVFYCFFPSRPILWQVSPAIGWNAESQ